MDNEHNAIAVVYAVARSSTYHLVRPNEQEDESYPFSRNRVNNQEADTSRIWFREVNALPSLDLQGTFFR